MMPTQYKIYAMVLTDRLKNKVEGKGVIPQNQISFRKRMKTINNMYTLNCMENQQIKKEISKLIFMMWI